MFLGPATNRQATGWVTVRRPTRSVITDAAGDCEGEAIGDPLAIGDGIGGAVPEGVGLGLAVGIDGPVQDATAIRAPRTIRLRRMTASHGEEDHDHDGRPPAAVSPPGWIAT